jgi:hypothetical protein
MMPSILKTAEEAHRRHEAFIRNVMPIFETSRQVSETYEQIERSMNQFVIPQIEALQVAQRFWSKQLVTGFEKARINAFPPNLRPIAEDLDFEDVLSFVENEGIALYLVPRASTAKLLLTAKDRAARRAVLGRKFTSIVEDCTVVLDRCRSSVTTTAVEFIESGVAALNDGHLAPAQAMFTNVLETLLQTTLTKSERSVMLSHKEGEGPQSLDLKVREAYVMLPIWRSYESYWKSRGDPIPTNYSRHATAHGVSKRQYSKRNTVQSLMLVTSYVGFVNGW